MLFLQFCLILISHSIIFVWAGQIQDKWFDGKVIKIVRLGKCAGTNLDLQLFVRFGKCTLRSVSVNNSTVIAKKNVKDKLKLTISFNRCASRENLDSCEEYYKARNLDLCQSISPDTFLSGVSNLYVVSYTPTLKCPIKQGTYHAYNFTFSMMPFVLNNLDGWYWRVKSEIFSSTENNRLVGCVMVEGYTKL